MARRRKRPRNTDADRYYDRYKRNKDAKRFYNSAAWKRLRLLALQRDHYLCQPCLRRGVLTPADDVHHIEPIEKAPDRALDLDNVESICDACHNREHPEKGKRSEEERPVRARVVEMKPNPEVV